MPKGLLRWRIVNYCLQCLTGCGKTTFVLALYHYYLHINHGNQISMFIDPKTNPGRQGHRGMFWDEVNWNPKDYSIDFLLAFCEIPTSRQFHVLYDVCLPAGVPRIVTSNCDPMELLARYKGHATRAQLAAVRRQICPVKILKPLFRPEACIHETTTTAVKFDWDAREKTNEMDNYGNVDSYVDRTLGPVEFDPPAATASGSKKRGRPQKKKNTQQSDDDDDSLADNQ